MKCNFTALKAFGHPDPNVQVVKQGQTCAIELGSELYNRLRERNAIQPASAQDVQDEQDWRNELGGHVPNSKSPLESMKQKELRAEAEKRDMPKFPVGTTNAGMIEAIREHDAQAAGKGPDAPAGAVEDEEEAGGAPAHSKPLQSQLEAMNEAEVKKYAHDRGLTSLPAGKDAMIAYILEAL